MEAARQAEHDFNRAAGVDEHLKRREEELREQSVQQLSPEGQKKVAAAQQQAQTDREKVAAHRGQDIQDEKNKIMLERQQRHHRPRGVGSSRLSEERATELAERAVEVKEKTAMARIEQQRKQAIDHELAREGLGDPKRQAQKERESLEKLRQQYKQDRDRTRI